MKKILVSILILFVSIFAVIFANGCYFVFFHQDKSMAKIRQGKELNLYECCNIYSIHTAIWMFGWVISPEAAEQAFLMTLPPKDREINNDYFITPKNTLRYRLAFPDDLKVHVFEYEDCFFDLLGNPVHNTTRMYTCSFQVTYSDTVYQVNNIKIYGKLLKYIQDKGWIHEFKITYR